jgi:DnaJ-class molecular chaperone
VIDFREQAEAKGFREETCAACDGRSKRLFIGRPGVEREDPCAPCEGTGRMWSMRGRMPWIPDSQMHAQLGL